MPTLSDYVEEVQRCMRCGFCRTLCPSFSYIGWETSSPRGRMQLLKAYLDGQMSMNDAVKERIYECTLCGYCLWRCPAGVKTIDVLKAARGHLLEMDKGLEGSKGLRRNLAMEHNIYGLQHDTRIDWLSYPWIGLKDKAQVGKKGAEILYFVGCVCSYSGKKNMTGKATMQILDKTGANWTLLGKEEWCCGDPALLIGDLQYAIEAAKHNVEKARSLGIERVVTSCAGCYHTWKEEYPKLLGESLDIEVQHIVQYIEESLKHGKLKIAHELKAIATYHDPCELSRLGGVIEEPRRVLKSIPGLEFRELPKNRYVSRCCGGGGDLKILKPELSMKIGERRIREAFDIDASLVVSGCPACELQLMDAAQSIGKPIQVLNIAEVVARTIA
ncbi:MAG: (Fe-S)-binding protein [Candidatus Bathyarchaeia archaeon]